MTVDGHVIEFIVGGGTLGKYSSILVIDTEPPDNPDHDQPTLNCDGFVIGGI
jgi:hypothetical protein